MVTARRVNHTFTKEFLSHSDSVQAFECMGMGIPVLHGVAGETAEIVGREQIGEFFEPENAEQLVEGLLRLCEDSNYVLGKAKMD